MRHLRRLAGLAGLPLTISLCACSQSDQHIRLSYAADLTQGAATPGGRPLAAALPAVPPISVPPEPAAPRQPAAEVARRVAAIRARARQVHSYQVTQASGGTQMTAWLTVVEGRATHLKTRADPNAWMLYDPAAQSVYSVVDKPAQVFARNVGNRFRMPLTMAATVEPLLDAATSVTDDTVFDTACDKVAVDDNPQTRITVWLDKDHGLPRRLEAGEVLVSMTYAEINAVPDDAFELPRGVAITDTTGLSGFGSGPMPFSGPAPGSGSYMPPPPRPPR